MADKKPKGQKLTESDYIGAGRRAEGALLDPWRYTDEQKQQLAAGHYLGSDNESRHRGLPKRGRGRKGDLGMPGREFGVPGYGTSKAPNTYRTVSVYDYPSRETLEVPIPLRIKKMKQDAGYNSLTTEMINKKNGGDK